MQSYSDIFNTLTAGVFRELLTYPYFLAARKKD